MILDKAALQYWHSRFNYMFFENALEPAIIRLKPANDEATTYDPDAEFIGSTEPFLINFYIDVSMETAEYVLTVLLHEMVHQYCCENDIEDMNDDEHTEEFREVAEMCGLTIRGYALSEWARDAIRKQLKLFDIASEL